MSYRRARFLHIDTSTWPAVDHHALPAERRSKFIARHTAVELYIGGSPLREIAKQTGISSRQLYWLLDRCLKPAEDGQVFGFRALIKGFRTTSYTRTAALAVNRTGTVNGYAGSFALLLERYPGLAAWLQHKIDKRAVVLDQIGTDGSLKTRLRGLASLHAGFIMQCRAVGITGADYPLNTERMGIRSVSTYIKAELLNKFGVASRAAGVSRTQSLSRLGFSPRRTAARPYQIVEFDGHRLDVRLKIVIRDPLGFEQEVEIERVWLLVIIDVCTRAVLGYNLVLSREYSRHDVIKTIERALVPHTPRSFTLPGVGYGTSGEFPSADCPNWAMRYGTESAWTMQGLIWRKLRLACLPNSSDVLSMPDQCTIRTTDLTSNASLAQLAARCHHACQAIPGRVQAMCVALWQIQRVICGSSSRLRRWKNSWRPRLPATTLRRIRA
jgi:putative transposase